jgi:hypothetical protein
MVINAFNFVTAWAEFRFARLCADKAFSPEQILLPGKSKPAFLIYEPPVAYYLSAATTFMKKRAFFLTSLPLALIALGAQAAGIILLVCYVAEVTSMQVLPFVFLQSWANASQQQNVPPSPSNTIGMVILSGLILAILSLACLIVSFRRHEPGWGWRLIPIVLLTVYLGSWLVLLHG